MMKIKLKNKTKTFDLLDRNKYEVCEIMERHPDGKHGEVWYYILDVSWLIRKTVLFVEFEDDIAQCIYVRMFYGSPLTELKKEYAV